MKKGQQKAIVILLIIGIAIGLIFIFIALDTNLNESSSITGNVIKTLKNCRDVEIPYTVTEEYDYYPTGRVISGSQKESFNFERGIYQEGKVLLNNVDNEAGWFTVSFNWETLNDERKDNVKHYIEPDETIEFLSIYDNDLGEDTKFTYNFKADSITKTRTVTKYRIEEKCD
ncbi:hypothetical protein CMI37_19360 [Candidatus Pacearchaeota archaeon]|nr:hypothetical protein [Candidatus Pacearchaeota archaeon]|tara:strand:+ start:63 stop:578 length:516 start_codon:yes stop_codon:yes gene_type:complete